MKLTMNSLALALTLAGLSGAACAQSSSVTLFGLIDANVGNYKGAATGITPADTAVWRQDSGGMSTSYFGLRGTEDLGGGLLATFELQSFMRNDTGASGRSDAICAPAPSCAGVNVAADPFFAKAAWVGLSSDRFGRVRLGQLPTAIFIGSVTSNAFGDSTNFSPINLLMFVGSPLAGGTGWSNSLSYDSPDFAGFSLNLQKSLAEGPKGGNIGGRVGYAAGPLAASVAYTDVKKDPVTFSDGTTANNTKNTLVSASYDFGAIKLYGHLGRIKSDGSSTPTPADDNITYKVWDLSATVPIGVGRITAAYGSRKGTEVFSSQRNVTSVGYDYNLSRRTDLYFVVRNDKARAAGTTAPAADAAGTSYVVGIRHMF